MKQTDIPNVYQKGKMLFTKNLVEGYSVPHDIIQYEQGMELRYWDPYRSKLAAALSKSISGLAFREENRVLYLGASTGTTVSHISDISTKGVIFAVEFSPDVFAKLYVLALKRHNIVPLLRDASRPEGYYHRITAVDFVYQDIAQRRQLEIFKRNCKLFLKPGCRAALCVKSRSIDVAESPKNIMKAIKSELKQDFVLVDFRKLEPYQKDHGFFVVQLKG